MSGRKRASQSTPDFQKKKIKVGKGKRPADNATNASFTTGRISVPSQLQAPNKDEIVSNRKLTVKSLFNQLKHPNPTKRSDALKDLREVFTEEVSLVKDVFPSLVEQTIRLYVDEVSTVRHSFYLLLKSVLPQMNTSTVLAYRQRLLACLECGLTHILSVIRMDAVKCTALFLTHHPSIFGERLLSFTMLHVQILAKAVHLEENTGAAGRKTTSKPHTFAWITLIDRIVQFLLLLLSSLPSQPQRSPPQPPALHLTDGRIDVLSDDLDVQMLSRQFCCVHSGTYHILPHGFKNAACLLGTDMCLPGETVPSSSKGARLRNVPEAKEVEQLLVSLMPLLLECWVEAAPPAAQESGIGSMHNLECMLKVSGAFLSLVRLVSKHNISVSLPTPRDQMANKGKTNCESWKKASEDFLKQLLLRFPFSKCLVTLLARELSLKSDSVSAILSMDLFTCELLLMLLPILGEGKVQEFSIHRVNAFVKNEIPNIPVKYSSVAFSALVSTSVSILLEMLALVSKPVKLNLPLVSEVIGSLFQFYSKLHVLSSARTAFNEQFASLTRVYVKNGDIISGDAIQSNLLLPWLASLPGQVVEVTSGGLPTAERVQVCGDLLRVMVTVGPVGMIPFGESLQENMLKILSNLEGTRLPLALQRCVVELVLYLPVLDTVELKAVKSFVYSGALDLSSVKYLLRLISQRLVKSAIPLLDDVSPEEEDWQILLFLQFMLTMAIGYSEGELDEVQRKYCSLSQSLSTVSLSVGSVVVVQSVGSSDVLRVELREEITSCVCECLSRTSFSDQLLELTEDFFVDLLASEEHMYLPVFAVCRVLQVLLSFVKESLSTPDGLHKALVEFLTTVLLTVASLPDKESTALGLQNGVSTSTDAQPLSSGRPLSTTTAVLSTRHTSGPSCTPVAQLHSTAPHTPAVLPGSIAQSDTVDLCTPVPPPRAGRQPNPTVPYTPIATQNTAAQTPTPYTSSTDVPMGSDHVASEQFKKCFCYVIEILVVSEQLLADILESFNSLLLGLCTQFCGVCVRV
jgi:hypothetical protein